MKRKLLKLMTLSLCFILLFSLVGGALAAENGGQEASEMDVRGTSDEDDVLANIGEGEGDEGTVEVEFDIEMEVFDWGQNVKKIYIDMGDFAELPEDINIDPSTFEVTAKGVTYFDWSQYREVTADFPRTVDSVKVSGNVITLHLVTSFEEGTAGGNGFASYEINQVKDIEVDEEVLVSAGALVFVQDEVYDIWADKFERRTAENGLAYRLYVPDLEVVPEPGYPLIVWLHGAGEFGDDNHAQISANKVTGWAYDEAQEIFGGAYVMAPQNHSPEQTVAAIQEVLDEFTNIDENRIYIGGCSMGGAGTWDTIIAYPDLFAAAFPICPAKLPTTEELEKVIDMPIWLIHSVDDNTVSVYNSIEAINRMKYIGMENVYMSLFDHVVVDGKVIEALGHWSWVYVHSNFDGSEEHFTSESTLTDPNGNVYTDVENTIPSEVGDGYETFMHWLADQNRINIDECEVKYRLESEGFDWGEGISKVHLYMKEEVDPEDINNDTFKVTAKNYSYIEIVAGDDGNFEIIPKTADIDRMVTDVSVSGKKIILTLGCAFDITGSNGAGMAFEDYEISLNEVTPRGVREVSDETYRFVQIGEVFNVLEEKFEAGTFTSEEHAITHTPWIQDDEGDWVQGEEVIIDYINYRIYKPATQDEVPMIVWLHGGGETGTDNRIQLVANRVTAWIEPEAQEVFGGAAYVLAPQTSVGWGDTFAPMVIALIEDIIANNNIDPERIYIGGCSMGGMGTWTTILEKPELFAAAFPICGGTGASDEQLAALVDMPIWVIHSVDDSTVPVSGSIEAYNRLKDLGSNDIHMTLFEHVVIDGQIVDFLGHWSWVYVHNNFDGTEEYILHGTDLEIVSGENEYSDVVSEFPSDYGNDTFKDWLAAQLTPAPEVSGSPIKLEAEVAKLVGASVVQETSVRANREENKITFRFNLDKAGRYNLTLRLAPTGNDAREDVVEITVNGNALSNSINLPADSSGEYANHRISGIQLVSGENTIEITINGEIVQSGWYSTYVGYAELDYIELTYSPYVAPVDPPVTPPDDDTEEPDPIVFIDLGESHWVYDDIITTVRRGLFIGTSEGRFSPELNMSRAMLVTVLGRLANVDPEDYEGRIAFSDVPQGTWYTGYTIWASENGIIVGRVDGSFDPNSNITREELAVMVYRYLRFAGIEVDVLEEAPLQFTDYDSISDWAVEAVTYLQNIGLLQGKPGNIFDPAGNATRAEVATIMARLMDILDS